jgi:alanyl-tRNA synthetase
VAQAIDVAGARVVVADAGATPPGDMRQLIDQLRRQGKPTAVLLGARDGDKVMLVAGISPDLETKGVHAGEWIRAAAAAVGGSGGGRPDMAQAGGKEPGKLPAALEIARKTIAAQLAGK